MPIVSLLATALSLTAAPLAPTLTPWVPSAGSIPHGALTDSAPEPRTTVRVDSTHGRIIIEAGPFRLADMSGMDHMDHMRHMDHAKHVDQMDHMSHATTPLMRFRWPVEGWMRGFHVDVHDAAGRPLPSSILHHLIGVNLDRRQLVYPAVERLFGWGAETAPVELPGSMGVPLKPGSELGMYAMFDNKTGKDIDSAYLRVTLLYTPKQGNNPLSVLPLYIDVNNVIGGVTTFDVPPGKSSKSYEFELPASVRLIGVGGHLHDYGTEVRLEDARTGKVLVRLKAKRDGQGHVEGVGRFIFGFGPDALHLEAGHRYRVVADYSNPTADTIRAGGMAHINGAVVPDDMNKWPALDPNDPLIQKDIATLPGGGDGVARSGHEGSGAKP